MWVWTYPEDSSKLDYFENKKVRAETLSKRFSGIVVGDKPAASKKMNGGAEKYTGSNKKVDKFSKGVSKLKKKEATIVVAPPPHGIYLTYYLYIFVYIYVS